MIPISHETGICEWMAPKRPPAPTTERITSGTLCVPPVRNQYFVAWLIRLSIESARKSPNMISSTGRSPVIAAPYAAPVIASSEIGVSNTRAGAVLLDQTRRDREHAAGHGDVLAEEDHALVARELLVERVADRLAELDLRHAVPPSSSSSVGCSSSSRRRCRKRAASAP